MTLTFRIMTSFCICTAAYTSFMFTSPVLNGPSTRKRRQCKVTLAFRTRRTFCICAAAYTLFRFTSPPWAPNEPSTSLGGDSAKSFRLIEGRVYSAPMPPPPPPLPSQWLIQIKGICKQWVGSGGSAGTEWPGLLVILDRGIYIASISIAMR